MPVEITETAAARMTVADIGMCEECGCIHTVECMSAYRDPCAICGANGVCSIGALVDNNAVRLVNANTYV